MACGLKATSNAPRPATASYRRKKWLQYGPMAKVEMRGCSIPSARGWRTWSYGRVCGEPRKLHWAASKNTKTSDKQTGVYS